MGVHGCRCAWLNHSVNPHAFIESVKRHPRIKAWFSGHFHLSHNYADSVAAAFGCAFVQTGVIGEHCHRDGFRQSRLLRASPTHCQVRTAAAMGQQQCVRNITLFPYLPMHPPPA